MDIILVLNEPEQRTESEDVMSCFFSIAGQNPRDTGDVEEEYKIDSRWERWILDWPLRHRTCCWV